MFSQNWTLHRSRRWRRWIPPCNDQLGPVTGTQNDNEQDTKAFAGHRSRLPCARAVERFVQSFQARSNQLASAPSERTEKMGTILGKEIQCQSTFPTLGLRCQFAQTLTQIFAHFPSAFIIQILT